MSLYKRGDVWWYDFTVNGERVRGSTKRRSKASASKVEQLAVENAQLVTSGQRLWTLEQAADKWFAAKVAGRRSEVTTATRLEILLRHVPAETDISTIDSPIIADVLESRRLERAGHNWKTDRAPSNATVNRDIIDTTLRPVLNYAKKVLKARIHDIPWSDLKLPESKDRDRPYTTGELLAWRDALPEWHRPIFDFYRRYGARMKEAFFPPENYDPTTGRIILRWRKGGKPHTIRLLPDDAAAMNARYSRAVADALPSLWFRDVGGDLTPITWRAFQSASRAAAERCGLADVHPVHDLRHIAGMGLMRGRGDLTAVKRMLGHESVQSTMRYIHADDDDVFDALRHTYVTPAEKQPKTSKKSKVRTGT